MIIVRKELYQEILWEAWDGGRRLTVRLDKDKTDLNESFEGFKRGDVVSLENGIDEGKRLRVGKETKVFLNQFCNHCI